MAAVVHKQDTSANGYSTTDDVHGSRMPVVPFQNAGGSGAGETYTKLETRYRLLMSLMQSVMSGQIIEVDGGGLKCGMLASRDGNFDYWLNGTKYVVAENANFAVTASVANHISVDATGVLEKTAGAWPGTDHWKLAIVTCDGSEVTAIKDCRFENLDPAAANGWFNTAAGATVDMAGNDLHNIGELDFAEATTLTLSSDAITPTQGLHAVAAQTGITDDLATIAATAGERKMLFLRADTGDTITVVDTGNLNLISNLDFALGDDGYIVFLQDTDTTWTELFRSQDPSGNWARDINANTYMLSNLGQLAFDEEEKTIVAGEINQWGSELDRWSFIRVDTEADAAADDLKGIGGNIGGTLLWLRPENGARVVTVKHDFGGGNIKLANSQDFIMADITHTICLRYDADDVKWYEVSRSHWITENLVGTGFNVPYNPGMVIAGTNLTGVPLTQRTLEIRQDLPFAGKIINVTGHVNTAPSGGTFVCDVLLNGVTIFASGAERINIPAGQNEDTSEIKNASFSAGDTLTYQVTTLWAADDLTIVPKIQVDLAAAP